MKKILSFVVMGLLLVPVPSYAAWMAGVVKSVDETNRTIVIERDNAEQQEASIPGRSV